MAEEQTAVVEQPEVDQAGYVGDVFESYINNDAQREAAGMKPAPRSSGAPAAKPQAQTPKAGTQIAQKPPADKAAADAQKPTAEPPKAGQEQTPAENQPDPLELAFSGEDGAFDVEKLVEFSPPSFAEETATDLGKETEPEATPEQEWQREYEAEREYEKKLRTGALGGIEEAYNLIKQGMDPLQALKQTYAKIEGGVAKMLEDRKAQREFERTRQFDERMKARERQRTMEENSKTNIAEIVSRLPGADSAAKTKLFNHLVFSKEVGAPILDHYFREKHPDIDKLPEGEKRKLAGEFLKEITSDKRRLAFVFQLAYDRATRLKMPKLLEKTRLAKEAEIKNTEATAQKAPTGTTQRTKPGGGADPWENYLNSHHKHADRV